MVVFWIIAALLSAAAAAAIMAGAAAGARAAAHPIDDSGLILRRRQLAEVDDLAERGLLASGERDALRAEAARRLLDAAQTAQPAPAATPRDRLAVLAVAGITVVLALGVYLAVGSPGDPDQPFAKRVAAWRASDPASLNPLQMGAVLGVMARQNPTDPMPLQAMAITQLASDQPIAAQTSLRKAIALAPNRADLWSTLGEAFVAGAGGTVDADAQRAFAEALKRDPNSLAARYYLGRAALAAGDREGAVESWRAVLARLPADDRRRAALDAEIAAATAAPSPGAGGPSAAQIDAAQGQIGPDQIRAMVAGLATRLEANPDDADGWVRLVRAYGVLGDTAKRDAALRTARTRFARRPEVLAALQAAAR